MLSKYRNGDNVISCKEYFEIEKDRVKHRIESSDAAWFYTPVLDIFQVGDNPASNVYIKNKIKDCEDVGIEPILHRYSEDVDAYDLRADIVEASHCLSCDGIILQLPVPNHIDPVSILKDSIVPCQDVDGFLSTSKYKPCTPRGIIDYLEYNEINLNGKNCLVIGRSNIVGKPLAKMLVDKNATVTLAHSHTPEDEMIKYAENADIVFVAVGKPKWLKFAAKNSDVIIVDIGINRDEDGKLCGDVDYEYMTAQGCYVTPVPGGVGLLTRIALLKNVVGH